MTARDDYPVLAHLARNPQPTETAKDAAEALDEIDLLRAALTELETARGRYGPTSRAQDERRP